MAGSRENKPQGRVALVPAGVEARILSCVATNASQGTNANLGVAIPVSQFPVTTFISPEVIERRWNVLRFKPYDAHFVVADTLAEPLGTHLKRSSLVPYHQFGCGRGLWVIDDRKKPSEWLTSWAISAREIAFGIASQCPVLISRDTTQKRYVAVPIRDRDSPSTWRDFDYTAFVIESFAERIIDDEEHPIYRYLTGRGGL